MATTLTKRGVRYVTFPAATGSRTYTFTKITGTAKGDLMIVAISSINTAITAPTGWTLLKQVSAQLFAPVAIFYKIATATEPGSYTFRVTPSRSGYGILVNYYDAHVALTSANIVTLRTDGDNSSDAPSSGSPADTSATSTVLWFLAIFGIVTVTPPSGFTGTHTPRLGLWTKAPGKTTGSVWTGSLSANDVWTTITLVLDAGVTPPAPSPISPAPGAYLEEGALTFKATYNSADGSDANAYCLAIKQTTLDTTIQGAKYWKASTGTLVATPVWNTCSVAPGTPITVTVSSGVLTAGKGYLWAMAAQASAANLQGPLSVSINIHVTTGPALTITGPSGIVSVGRPTVSWTATPAATHSIANYHLRVFTAAQAAATGFTPGTSTAIYDSGTVSGNPGVAPVGTTLLSGTTYVAYIQVKDTASVASAWVATAFMVSFTAPAQPTVTAESTTTSTTGYPCVKLTVQGHTNLLSAEDASFETGIGTWTGTNATLTRSSTESLNGTHSLQIKAVASGTATAKTAHYAVEAAVEYTASVEFRAASTTRTVRCALVWLNASTSIISTTYAAAQADSSSGWIKVHLRAPSPSGAVHAYLEVQVLTATATEIHYADEAGIFPGTVTTWTAGGFVGTDKVMIVRSTVTPTATPYTPKPMYVRGASTANKATVPSPSQTLVLYDRECFPGIEYTYRGVIVSGSVNSGTGLTSGSVKVTPTEWWEIDPTTPTSAISAQPTQWNPQQIEQSTATQVTGVAHMTVIANVVMNQDFMGTFELFTGPMYKALKKLLSSQKILFMLSPFSDLDSGYFRVGPQPGGLSTGVGNKTKDAQLWASTSAAPHRTVQVSAVAQPRPQV